MRLAVLLASSVVCFAQQPGDLRQLVRDSLRFMEGSNRTNDFDYSWRSERKQFDSSGKITSQTTLVGEKLTKDGVDIHQLIERDGSKLTEQQMKEQEAEIAGAVARHNREQQKKGGRGDEWVREVPDALNFQLIGQETVNGRAVWVLSCTPRPGYSAKNMRARVFEKMNGRMWIDKADRELVRVEAETFDTVSIGLGILGKVEKGTRFELARTRLPEGPWVLDSQSIRFGARVMLVKWLGNEIHTKHWNYRRKQT